MSIAERILELISDPLLYFNSGIITFINKSFSERSGITKDEIFGLSIEVLKQYMTVSSYARVFNASTQSFCDSQPMELKYLDLNGRPFDALILGNNKGEVGILWKQTLPEQENIVGGAGENVENIEPKRIAPLSELSRRFFDICPILKGLIEVDEEKPDFRFLVCNEVAAKAFKTTREELENHSLVHFGLPRNRIDFWVEKFRQAKAKKNPMVFYSNSEFLQLHGQVTIIHENGNRYLFFISSLNQLENQEVALINEKETLEQLVQKRTMELEKASAAKSRFLAIMSHEIRTPLCGVMGMTNLLTDFSLPSVVKDMITTANICGEQLRALIDDILDFTSMEDNKLKLEMVPVCTMDVLEESLEVVAIEAEKKELELILKIENIPDWFIGDSARIRQVLVNLLGNAVKFSKMGEIILSARARELGDDRYEINFSVSDHGIGIPDELKKSIFQPFSQVDVSSTRRYGGTGLGLAISRKLVELMGGSMNLESLPDHGSTFYCSIQVFKTVPPKCSPRIVHCELGNVMIIESNPLLLQSLHQLLSHWNIVTTPCSSIEEALHILTFQKCTHILVDNKFGVEDIRRLKDFGKVIVMGQSTSAIAFNGEFKFLRKPIRHQALFDVLVLQPTVLKRNSMEMIGTTPIELRILVAEDNLTNQRVIKQVLLSLGCSEKLITIVENGRLAVEAVQQQHFDLILMDIMMPEMCGLDATERIKKVIPPDSLPRIVALTANSLADQIAMCKRIGMEEVLTKPINKEALRSVLISTASKKQKIKL